MKGDTPFDGRIALVTGASGGIGRAVGLALAQAGAAVALACGSDRESAEALAQSIREQGGHAVTFQFDLRLADSARALFEATEESLGKVDLLVNNAGIGGRSQALEDVSAAEFDELIAVNLRAPFLLARHAAPAMRERNFGRILFISSVAAFAGGFIGPHYCASKAGLHGLMHSLAPRLAPAGVTVNTLAPARISGTGIPQPSDIDAGVPVGRAGTPVEVADMALAMLRNPYLTNKVVSLDGGIYPR